mmetsp:Transcript_18578/g.51655  ORF Transcript_18578/g.51655 Transcript_18578/m.51655 type:complete len:92 (-) Transcript_18578:465-740(-)
MTEIDCSGTSVAYLCVGLKSVFEQVFSWRGTPGFRDYLCCNPYSAAHASASLAAGIQRQNGVGAFPSLSTFQPCRGIFESTGAWLTAYWHE